MTKSTKAIGGAAALRSIPLLRTRVDHNEVKEVEAFIHLAGGKPVARGTLQLFPNFEVGVRATCLPFRATRPKLQFLAY